MVMPPPPLISPCPKRRPLPHAVLHVITVGYHEEAPYGEEGDHVACQHQTTSSPVDLLEKDQSVILLFLLVLLLLWLLHLLLLFIKHFLCTYFSLLHKAKIFLKMKTQKCYKKQGIIYYFFVVVVCLFISWPNYISWKLHTLCLTLTTGAVEGERARTMGRPKAETTIAAVTKYANSLHGLLAPVSSDTLRAIMLGIGANT